MSLREGGGGGGGAAVSLRERGQANTTALHAKPNGTGLCCDISEEKFEVGHNPWLHKEMELYQIPPCADSAGKKSIDLVA